MYTKTIADAIPVASDVLALEVEELAGVLLAYLNTVGDPVVQNRLVSQHNFFAQFDESFAKLPPDYKAQQDSVVSALLEAWETAQKRSFPSQGPHATLFTTIFYHQAGKKAENDTRL